MCDMYKSFDFSELDKTSYFYEQLANYYEHEVDKSKFHSLQSFSCLDPSSRTNTTDIASPSSWDSDRKCTA